MTPKHFTPLISLKLISLNHQHLRSWKLSGRDLPEEDKQALEDVSEVVVPLYGSEGVHHLDIQ